MVKCGIPPVSVYICGDDMYRLCLLIETENSPSYGVTKIFTVKIYERKKIHLHWSWFDHSKDHWEQKVF